MRIRNFVGHLYARWQGVNIGNNSRISPKAEFTIHRDGIITLGNKCEIHKGVILATYPSGNITIGDDCSINPYCVLYGHGGLKIGNSVRIATHVVIVPANHTFDMPDVTIHEQKVIARGITIEDDVWIGAGARILDGVTISSGCVIAAGAVVNKSTDIVGVYAGVPARLVKRRQS